MTISALIIHRFPYIIAYSFELYMLKHCFLKEPIELHLFSTFGCSILVSLGKCKNCHNNIEHAHKIHLYTNCCTFILYWFPFSLEGYPSFLVMLLLGGVAFPVSITHCQKYLTITLEFSCCNIVNLPCLINCYNIVRYFLCTYYCESKLWHFHHHHATFLHLHFNAWIWS